MGRLTIVVLALGLVALGLADAQCTPPTNFVNSAGVCAICNTVNHNLDASNSNPKLRCLPCGAVNSTVCTGGGPLCSLKAVAYADAAGVCRQCDLTLFNYIDASGSCASCDTTVNNVNATATDPALRCVACGSQNAPACKVLPACRDTDNYADATKTCVLCDTTTNYLNATASVLKRCVPCGAAGQPACQVTTPCQGTTYVSATNKCTACDLTTHNLDASNTDVTLRCTKCGTSGLVPCQSGGAHCLGPNSYLEASTGLCTTCDVLNNNFNATASHPALICTPCGADVGSTPCIVGKPCHALNNYVQDLDEVYTCQLCDVTVNRLNASATDPNQRCVPCGAQDQPSCQVGLPCLNSTNYVSYTKICTYCDPSVNNFNASATTAAQRCAPCGLAGLVACNNGGDPCFEPTGYLAGTGKCALCDLTTHNLDALNPIASLRCVACGLTNRPACTTGQACTALTGYVDVNGLCQVCSISSHNLDAGNTDPALRCVPCGGLGQPVCVDLCYNTPAGNQCCSKGQVNSTCAMGFGFCDSGKTCQSCGQYPGQYCCPGASVNSTCGMSGNAYCLDSGDPAGLVCAECGVQGALCCPFSTTNQTCDAGYGYCKDTMGPLPGGGGFSPALSRRLNAVEGPTATDALTCVGCGFLYEDCCPSQGANPGDSCASGSGYCAATDGYVGTTCLPCNQPYQTCCPSSSVNDTCASSYYGSFFCQDNGAGVLPTCSPCGQYAGNVCCPGDQVNSTCANGYGFCGQDPMGGSDLICQGCGSYNQNCCPPTPDSTAVALTCPDTTHSYCQPGTDLATSQCVQCGYTYESCCEGAAVGDSCSSGYGYCRANPTPGALPDCVPCNQAGYDCCPGSTVNSTCNSGFGECKSVAGYSALQCVSCGYEGQTCCSGASANDPCYYGYAYCKAQVGGGDPVCTGCGYTYQDCCPSFPNTGYQSGPDPLGNAVNTSCSYGSGYCAPATIAGGANQCVGCSSAGFRCCPGDDAYGTSCNNGFGSCDASGMCVLCNRPGTPCCTGANADDSCYYGSAFCQASSSGSLTCTTCGTVATPCCPPQNAVGSACNYNFGYCAASSSGPPICTACGDISQPCCGGASTNSTCGRYSAGFCDSDGLGGLTCTACGGAFQQCCPGADAEGTSCLYGQGYCKASASNPLASTICTPCGQAGSECCFGAAANSTCGYYGNAFCQDSGSGTLQCVACGQPGQICCAGSDAVNQACGNQYNPGFCQADPNGGSPMCVQCGYGTYPCCPNGIPGMSSSIQCYGSPTTSYCDATTSTCKYCNSVYNSCCPNQSVNATCSGGSGYCQDAGTGLLPTCTACGSAYQPCCPGSDAIDSFCYQNYYGSGVCKASSSGGEPICTPCGSLNLPCCTGAAVNSTCYTSTYYNGVCQASSSGTDLTCEICGAPMYECCPGAGVTQDSPCNYGFCDASPTDGTLMCTSCGSSGSRCCPGSSVGSSCNNNNGFCDVDTSGKLMCYACGSIYEPCCPSNDAVGSVCYSTTYQTGVCKEDPNGSNHTQCTPCSSLYQPCCDGSPVNSTCYGGFGYCAANPTGGDPICTACGHAGQVCCPGTAINDACDPGPLGYGRRGSSYCAADPNGGSPVCTYCGSAYKTCCPNDPNNGHCAGTDQFHCIPDPTGVNPLSECLRCGAAGLACCPGSAVGSACDNGICVASSSGAATPDCAPCGSLTQQCCSGSVVGSSCYNGLGVCDTDSTSGALTCMAAPVAAGTTPANQTDIDTYICSSNLTSQLASWSGTPLDFGSIFASAYANAIQNITTLTPGTDDYYNYAIAIYALQYAAISIPSCTIPAAAATQLREIRRLGQNQKCTGTALDCLGKGILCDKTTLPYLNKLAAGVLGLFVKATVAAGISAAGSFTLAIPVVGEIVFPATVLGGIATGDALGLATALATNWALDNIEAKLCDIEKGRCDDYCPCPSNDGDYMGDPDECYEYEYY